MKTTIQKIYKDYTDYILYFELSQYFSFKNKCLIFFGKKRKRRQPLKLLLNNYSMKDIEHFIF